MKIQKIVAQVKEEFQTYSRGQKLFLFFAMLCGFFITAEYAIIKPTSNSIFLTYYSVKLYPYAWLLTVPLNLVVVTLYNRFLSKLGCFKMFLCTIFLTMGINVLSGAFVQQFPPLTFLLYIWKDIYVLLMFQQLWSVIHTKTEISKAKYLYGILFGVSGIGAIFGSLVPSFFAVKMGSEPLLYMTIPLYLFFIWAYHQMLSRSGIEGEDHMQIKKAKGGFRLIRSSSALKFILLIVILMQLSTTIMDYQFNNFLQQKFPMQDLRTQFYGRLWGMINICKLCLQFFATFLLVQFLGLRKSHFVVPGILLGNAALTLIAPSFGVITYGFSVIKTFDYSIFNILKEMLYVPLKTDEKFKAKVVIDVFAYRSAKAFASLFVIALRVLSPEKLPYAYSWGPFTLFVVWIGAVFFYSHRRQEKLLEA
ncbi:MAG: Npt1/Npt2 family nucleotide transporter [Candidatus Neptunochlamydia sp.]|nr:Npt1/Npt2 family nucleotide transporter [Candidatus Neptunochlamydia sp.]